jgi:hypothetical protein
MKARYIILFIAIAVPFTLAAQTPDLPREVKIQFMENYISASNVEWQKDRQDHYQARFTHQSQSKLSAYTNQGSWLYTETSMVFCQLPAVLQETLLYNYNDADILDINKIETDDMITYRFTIKDHGESEYAPDGTLVSVHPATSRP